MWLLSTFLFIFFTVTQSLWQRVYSQKSKLPETFPPAISYVLALVPLGIMVGLLMPHHVTWTSWLVLLLVVEGVFIGIFNWLMFVALRRMPVAKFEMIFQLYAVVVITLSWILLGEKLTPLQIFGGILLFTAAYIAISAPKESISQLHARVGKQAIIVTVCAAVALGIGLTTEKAALQHMDTGTYFIFGFMTQGIALILLAAKDVSKKTLKSIRRTDIQRSLVMGVLSALVGFAYIAAIQLSNNISLVTTLAAFALPLTVLAGYLFLHERENMFRMWVATIIGCIGLIIVAL